MDQNTHEKLVDFSLCSTCVNRDKTEQEEPCNACLANPVNFESTKPVKYTKDPKVKEDKFDVALRKQKERKERNKK